MFHKLLEHIHEQLDVPGALLLARRIQAIERRCSFRAFHQSAQVCLRALQEAGLQDLELLSVKCDGKSGVWDVVMPQAWEIREATLDVVEPRRAGRRLADYAVNPCNIAVFSAPTPPDGIETEVVLEEDRFLTDARGKIILHSNSHRPEKLRQAVDEVGAVGSISDWSLAPQTEPDGVAWINSFSSGCGWYPSAAERPAFCFSISPAQGQFLRSLMRKHGRVRVKAVVRSRLYTGSFDTVTGVIRGSAQPGKEILVLAHLYEPFPNDDACGAAGAIEMAGTLQRLIASGKISRPRRSLRFLFSWELYGFMAYLHSRRNELRNMQAAVNLDGCAMSQRHSGRPLAIILNPATEPVFQDALFERISKEAIRRFYPQAAWEMTHGSFGDDLFTAEPSLGIPAHWIFAQEGEKHHNSNNTFDCLDPGMYHMILAANAAYVCSLAQAGDKEAQWLAGEVARRAREEILAEAQRQIEEQLSGEGAATAAAFHRERARFLRYAFAKRLQSLQRFSPKGYARDKANLKALEASVKQLARSESRRVAMLSAGRAEGKAVPRRAEPWERMAANIIPTRKFKGMLMDLPRVPLRERRKDPRFNMLLSFMDGRQDLLALLRKAAAARNAPVTAEWARNTVRIARLLGKYGYLKLRHKVSVTGRDLEAALTRCGIRKGDAVFVHSSLSSLGNLVGGPEMVIATLKNQVGGNGTLVMPAFSRNDSVVHDGLRELKGARRPFDPATNEPWTGRLPTLFLRQEGVRRSAHPTHSIAAWGREAEELVQRHKPTDSPCGWNSVFGQLWARENARFLFLGVVPGCMTFLHFFEDVLDYPYMPSARVLVKENAGFRTVRISKYPSGPRDFYSWRSGSRTAAHLARVRIRGRRKLRLGLGSLEVFPARSLSAAVLKILAEEPGLFVKEDPDSPFCAKAKEGIRSRKDRILVKIAALRAALEYGREAQM